MQFSHAVLSSFKVFPVFLRYDNQRPRSGYWWLLRSQVLISLRQSSIAGDRLRHSSRRFAALTELGKSRTRSPDRTGNAEILRFADRADAVSGKPSPKYDAIRPKKKEYNALNSLYRAGCKRSSRRRWRRQAGI